MTMGQKGFNNVRLMGSSPSSLRVKFWLLCSVCIMLIIVYGSVFWNMFTDSPKYKPGNSWDKFHDDFHLHLEDKEFGHAGNLDETPLSEAHPNTYVRKSRMVAIGCAITLRMYQDISPSNIQYSLPLLRTLIPSFCSTASIGFDYHFYIAFDIDDSSTKRAEYLNSIYEHFKNIRSTLCPKEANVSLHFVQCSHSHNPAWAQNDAMMEAYLDDAEYFYRVNDDTLMLSPGWTEVYIDALRAFDPPFVGVVGPVHRGGNEFILTYDFVHRTHVDIFGYYYPRLFTDWWADDWITAVYGQERTIKLPGVKLKHTQEAGQRYKVQYDNGELVHYQVAHDRRMLNRYIYSALNPVNVTGFPKRVISMSLWGTDTKYTFGALRNAQLTPVYFPGWTLRVYVEEHESGRMPRYDLPPSRVVRKLASLGAEIVFVNTDEVGIPPMMWRFLPSDDMSLDCFIVRDADARLNDRDASVVKAWLKTDNPLHCIRDHPSHKSFSLSGGMWGARPKQLFQVIPVPWVNLMLGYGKRYGQDMTFLRSIIWQKVEPFAYCHDSVSCGEWKNAYPFPVLRRGTEHIGQVYDAFGYARDDDMKILREAAVVAECTLKNATYADPGDRHDQGTVEEINTNHIKQLEANIEKRKAHEKMQQALKDSVDNIPVIDTVQSNHREPGYNTVSGQNVQTPANVLTTNNITNQTAITFHRSAVVWVSSSNRRTVYDILFLMQNNPDVRFTVKTIGEQCKFIDKCRDILNKLIVNDTLTSEISYLKAKFLEQYEFDAQMGNVTHVLCTELVLCDLYSQLNKAIIVYLPNITAYIDGSHKVKTYSHQVLNGISHNPGNMILAGNMRDAEIIKENIQVKPLVIPQICSYVTETYSPSNVHTVILWTLVLNTSFLDLVRGYITRLLMQTNSSIRLDSVRSLVDYRSKVASYSAVIYIPSQSSPNTFCELYRMAVPIFVPSSHLLATWHRKYALLQVSVNSHFNPGNNVTEAQLESWLGLDEVYQRPHVLYFDSVRDLVRQMSSVNLTQVSNRMQHFNRDSETRSAQKWSFIFR